jgi:hypothetical protein
MFVQAGKPPDDSLEVSLFGTGVGEALAVHLGAGQWMLVDSCRFRGSEPLNLSYLKTIGVNPATDVRVIVATHWHDDHVAGLANSVEQCESAGLVFSSALASDEFRCLLATFSGRQIGFDVEKSGVREMARSLTILLDRRQAGVSYHPPVKTIADHRIFRRDDCEVFSLSPSPEAINEATAEAAALWCALEEEAAGGDGPRPSRAGIPCPERNHNAVALWLKWGGRRILLGADLEERGDPRLGWQAVLSCTQFPDSRAQAVKVAHHGSPNGDYAPVWNGIVVQSDPHAVLTAYNRGQTPRPSPEDIERIRGYTNRIYYTSLPQSTANQYSRTVERTINGVTRRRRALTRTPGHVQLRFASDGTVSAIVAGAAGQI